MNFRKMLVAVVAAFMTVSAYADEGMWLLHLMKEQNSIDLMKARGLKLEANDVYNPNGVSLKDAVGIFGGGCTGEIISPEGLILTNHHCGYSSIQMHSSVEHDYLTDGFWAMNRSEELPTPGLRFQFVDRIEDITDIVNAKIKSGEVDEITALTSTFLAKVAKEQLEKSDLNGKKGISVRALPFYAGNKFYMFYMKIYTDVRMVAAPPSSVGKFGGETDNWMWPRHTGDFSMFRIYADKNGDPADYSKDNVPLKTPKFLPISIKGLSEGDYAMIMGFPGSTSRYLTQSEVRMRMEAQNQPLIDIRTARLNVLREVMAASDKVRIQYASKHAGCSNYWKNSIGMNKAIIDNDVLGSKAEIERQFGEFAKGKAEYEGVVGKIDNVIAKIQPVTLQMTYAREAISAIEFRAGSANFEKLKEALDKKDKEGVSAAIFLIKNKLYPALHNKDYDHEVDRKVTKAVLKAYAEKVAEADRPAFFQTISKEYDGNIDAYVDDMYDNSILANEKNLNKFAKKPSVKALENDPMIAFSDAFMGKYTELNVQTSDLQKELTLLHKAYIRGLNEMKLPVPSYPDANFTMRLTYGTVKSYDPKDGVHYKFYTTTDGILEKENPQNAEFVVPSKLKQLIQARDFGRYAMENGDMPVCFLTTNDITGGNSGSPVIDGEGNLIGCAFDGNWESLSGDINFDDNLQRCIALDIRYVLFILEKFGNCKHLIDEMTIKE